MYTVTLDNHHGLVRYFADSPPDTQAIIECLLFLWKIDIGLVDSHDNLLR